MEEPKVRQFIVGLNRGKIKFITFYYKECIRQVCNKLSA